MAILLKEIFIVDIKDLSAAAGCAILTGSVVSWLIPYIGYYFTAFIGGAIGWLLFSTVRNISKKAKKDDNNVN